MPEETTTKKPSRTSKLFWTDYAAFICTIASVITGIQGLAIYDADGQLIAKGGAMPESIHPAAEPQWTTQGLVLSRQTPLSLPDFPEPRGRGPFGPGAGAGADQYQSPYWLTVLLDVAPYANSLNGDHRHYGAMLLVAWLTIALT